MRKKILFAVTVALMTTTTPVMGQGVYSDKGLQKQIRSIAGNGAWDFGESWLERSAYHLLHHKYSGSEMYWQWAGFKSGFRIRYKEEKASQKKLQRPLDAEIATAILQEEERKKQNENITKMFDEQMLVAADRHNPAVTIPYKEEFEQFDEYFARALAYAYTYGNDTAYGWAEGLADKYDMLTERIAYVSGQTIKGTGVMVGTMESGERMKALQGCHDEMMRLLKSTNDLVEYCKLTK